ncbi:MAG: esterase, partial [Comamonadaceae bacterium]
PLTRPERYFAVIAKGDEVLDWREMTGRYPGVRIKLLEHGDHALSDFDDHIDEVLAFLDLA